MNVGRGLFRAWILVTVLWAVGVILLAYSEIPSSIKNSKWEYIHYLRADVDPNKVDWTKAYYEIMKSPSKEHLEPTFGPIEYRYWEDRDKSVKDGSIILVEEPDGSLLYLAHMLSKEDQDYVSRAFWDQRWWRYAKAARWWAFGLIVPPLVLLAIGWAFLWVGRGFKTAKQ
jgi:hypothetical protein